MNSRLPSNDGGKVSTESWELHYIVPKYQRRGIGAHVLHLVVAGARASGLPVRVRILRVNPAKHFYERHGFKVVSETPERFFIEHPATHTP